MSGDRVITGLHNYEGHKDRFRAGVVINVDTGLDLNGRPYPGRAGTSFVRVLCQPRGKERKERVITECGGDLLRDTAEVRAKLLAAGFDPDQKNGIAILRKAEEPKA
jgi:hypothetical protein